MRVRIKPWDEAVKAALADGEDWSVEADSIYGIVRGFGSWGEVVDGYANNGVFYANNGFTYPFCVVDKYDEGADYIDSDDPLRYGEVITDDDVGGDIRIRLIAYEGDLWYHKMVDGEVVRFRRVGTADA